MHINGTGECRTFFSDGYGACQHRLIRHIRGANSGRSVRLEHYLPIGMQEVVVYAEYSGVVKVVIGQSDVCSAGTTWFIVEDKSIYRVTDEIFVREQRHVVPTYLYPDKFVIVLERLCVRRRYSVLNNANVVDRVKRIEVVHCGDLRITKSVFDGPNVDFDASSKKVVGPRGIEPRTCGLRVRCSA